MPRLVTSIQVSNDSDNRTRSYAALHELELADGRRVLLLDDRGWTTSGPPTSWAETSADDIADTARVVVGPDEPFGGQSFDDAARNHWAWLAEIAQGRGAVIAAAELRRLRHDVVFSRTLSDRLGTR